MKSRPAASASRASARQSGQLADQRSGTLVAERPDEQLAPNSPIFSALPLYMANLFIIAALDAGMRSPWLRFGGDLTGNHLFTRRRKFNRMQTSVVQITVEHPGKNDHPPSIPLV